MPDLMAMVRADHSPREAKANSITSQEWHAYSPALLVLRNLFWDMNGARLGYRNVSSLAGKDYLDLQRVGYPLSGDMIV